MIRNSTSQICYMYELNNIFNNSNKFRPFRDERCKELLFLPNPELASDSEHYKPFSEMYGKNTKDVSKLNV